MNSCHSFKLDGKQCTRQASNKPSHNQQFCWQHQKVTPNFLLEEKAKQEKTQGILEKTNQEKSQGMLEKAKQEKSKGMLKKAKQEKSEGMLEDRNKKFVEFLSKNKFLSNNIDELLAAIEVHTLASEPATTDNAKLIHFWDFLDEGDTNFNKFQNKINMGLKFAGFLI